MDAWGVGEGVRKKTHVYSKASQMDRPEFKSQLRQMPVLQTWARYLVSELLRFHIYKLV